VLATQVLATQVLATQITATGGLARSHAFVRVQDLRGDLHTHTNLTDGVASLADMVAAAAARGYEYYAVTDHAPNPVMQRMADEKILRQRAEAHALDAGAMTLLHGAELNIAPDGSLWQHCQFGRIIEQVARVNDVCGEERPAGG